MNHQVGAQNWYVANSKRKGSGGKPESALGRSACELTDIGKFSVALLWKMMNVGCHSGCRIL